MPARAAALAQLGLLPAPGYRQAVLNTTGLVAYWRLGGTAAALIDETGAFPGTWPVVAGIGQQPGPIRDGSMAVFNGSTQYASIADNSAFSPVTTGQMSWAFWTIPTNTTTSHVIAKGDAGGTWEWTIMRGLSPIFADGQAFLAQMWQSGGTSYAVVDSGAGSAVNGQTCHVAVTLTQAVALTIYINGQPRGRSTSFSGSMVDGTSAVNIGRRPDNTRFYAGALSDVAIWKRALGADEVRGLYEAGLA